MLRNGQSKDDIVSQIDAARRVFSILRKCLWTQRDISVTTKVCMYRASTRSDIYGCEYWAVRVEDERRLEGFDDRCLRTIHKMKYIDYISNEAVQTLCENITRISEAIQ
ncbi:unnamed protein product [Schistocephalus solidus]|uniref:Uncharacterized protein n=1 Tax=Schistocephalus solidus TaxID=70667 RepID=A0A183SRA7_SCHSO|nr:unnamed protein product [Schistocephalus solidus]